MSDQEVVDQLASEIIREFNRSHAHTFSELQQKLNEITQRMGELVTFMQIKGIDSAELQPPPPRTRLSGSAASTVDLPAGRQGSPRVHGGPGQIQAGPAKTDNLSA